MLTLRKKREVKSPCFIEFYTWFPWVVFRVDRKRGVEQYTFLIKLQKSVKRLGIIQNFLFRRLNIGSNYLHFFTGINCSHAKYQYNKSFAILFG